jgi:hypothetical protein
MALTVNGTISLVGIRFVRIVQRSTADECLIERDPETTCEITVIESGGKPLAFKISVDREDKEAVIILPDVNYKVTIDGYSEICRTDLGLSQKVRGSGNTIIGSVTGGTVIGDITAPHVIIN